MGSSGPGSNFADYDLVDQLICDDCLSSRGCKKLLGVLERAGLLGRKFTCSLAWEPASESN